MPNKVSGVCPLGLFRNNWNATIDTAPQNAPTRTRRRTPISASLSSRVSSALKREPTTTPAAAAPGNADITYRKFSSYHLRPELCSHSAPDTKTATAPNAIPKSALMVAAALSRRKGNTGVDPVAYPIQFRRSRAGRAERLFRRVHDRSGVPCYGAPECHSSSSGRTRPNLCDYSSPPAWHSLLELQEPAIQQQRGPWRTSRFTDDFPARTRLRQAEKQREAEWLPFGWGTLGRAR